MHAFFQEMTGKGNGSPLCPSDVAVPNDEDELHWGGQVGCCVPRVPGMIGGQAIAWS